VKRFLVVLLTTIAGLVIAVPAQAATHEQARWTVVDQVTITSELGVPGTINVLMPANGVAYQMRYFGQCINGHSCAWTDANYTSAMLDIVWSITCCGCWNLNGGFNDTISSSSTQFGSGYGIQWNKGNCTIPGNSTVQSHNTNYPNWANYQPAFGWNDSFSSFKIGLG